VRRAALAAVLLLSVPAGADAGGARILLTGVYTPETLGFGESRTFVENAEEGALEASYSMDRGFGGEIGVEYDFVPRFGIRASLSFARRNGEGTFEARLPHPLYLDHDRIVAGSAGGLEYDEAIGNVELVLILGNGPVQVSILGGVAVFRVDAKLLGDVQRNESYPYDTVELTGVTRRRLRDTPVGYGGAVAVDFRLSRHFALGVQARYSRARAELSASSDDTIAFDAGGLHAGFGLRLLF
jgi:hypothetical protein